MKTKCKERLCISKSRVLLGPCSLSQSHIRNKRTCICRKAIQGSYLCVNFIKLKVIVYKRSKHLKQLEMASRMLVKTFQNSAIQLKFSQSIISFNEFIVQFFISSSFQIIIKVSIIDLVENKDYSKMEIQTLETQKYQFLYSQISMLQAQKQNFRCPYKNQCIVVCINPQCQTRGLMCNDSNCQCMHSHFKCMYISLEKLFNLIRDHQKQIPLNFKKSYKVVRQIIDRLIEQLSQIKANLELQERYFRLKKKELAFMAVIDQQNIPKICNQISGKIVSGIKIALDSEIKFTIRNSEEIEQDFRHKKADFDRLFKYIQDHYMKQEKIFLSGSKIVDKLTEKKVLHKWLSEKSKQNKTKLSSELVFRASENRFGAAEFHKRCDGLRNTLVIIKNQFDKIIGGFNPNKWHSENDWVNDKECKAFMFSLTLNEKYECIDQTKSIYCHKSWGPAFGGGHDLHLSDNADINSSYANFARSYNLQVDGSNKYKNNQQTWTMFCGATIGYNFKVKQYEVYQIKEM